MYTPGTLGCLLGFWPLGQNPAGAISTTLLKLWALRLDGSVLLSHLLFTIYYMASSASGQDDPNRALWLATRAGKMEPSCPLGTTRLYPARKILRKPFNKSFIDQVCSAKMAGYWPRSFFASLWISTSSRSINTQKKNLANIQPSWPNKLGQWPIHTYGNGLKF